MTETLALHPNNPSTAATTTTHPAVLDQFDQAFGAFMGFMNDDYSPLAESMHKAAIDLYKQLSHHGKADQYRVGTTHEMDATDLAQDLLQVQSHQEPLWQKLQEDAHRLRQQVDAMYQKLQEADKAVVDACAYEGPHASWGGFATPEMQVIRHSHSKKLRHNMHEAKLKYDEVCGYPDGWLTRVDAIHDRTLHEAEAVIDGTNKKEQGHHHLFFSMRENED